CSTSRKYAWPGAGGRRVVLGPLLGEPPASTPRGDERVRCPCREMSGGSVTSAALSSSPAAARPDGATPPAIQSRGVNKWFGALHVLNGTALGVASGQVVVVCGPSGSGKSTLIRCVNRLESIQQGEILVAGEAVSGPGVNLPRLRAQVGMVFQSF